MSYYEYTRLRWKMRWNAMRGYAARKWRGYCFREKRREEQLEFRW